MDSEKQEAGDVLQASREEALEEEIERVRAEAKRLESEVERVRVELSDMHKVAQTWERDSHEKNIMCGTADAAYNEMRNERDAHRDIAHVLKKALELEKRRVAERESALALVSAPEHLTYLARDGQKWTMRKCDTCAYYMNVGRISNGTCDVCRGHGVDMGRER